MLEKIYQDRLKCLEKIRALGINPYGGKYDSAEPIADILDAYSRGDSSRRADAAGRIVLLRPMGKLIFAHLRDQSGTMQICLRRDALDERSWQLARLLDLGDIIAAAGQLSKTRTGEITIFADTLTLLCKSLLPMPEKFHGLVDVERRYRQRYLDLMSNPETMELARKRIAIIEHIRDSLRAKGFSEVETPMMQPIYGGAAAKPFITHHNALGIDLYLRISPELYLKRLLVGGMEKVFEINRNFRNEGIDSKHNPEFTMLELYQAYGDYNVMREITEELITTAVQRHCGGLKVSYDGVEIDFTRPWRQATYEELVKEYAGISMRDSSAVRKKADELGIEQAGKADAVILNEIFEQLIEPHLVQPTFVFDYPVELCPLTRPKVDDPALAERFELYIACMEIANAYTELNDPAIQEANFSQQLAGEQTGETMRVMDEDFITALRHGMPPAGGLGIGIDRLIMVLTGRTTIRDVILFPMLRPEAKKT